MSKATKALYEKTVVTHGLELYEYIATRNTRKNINIFELENRIKSCNKTLKEYKTFEKCCKDDELINKNKKLIKLL